MYFMSVCVKVWLWGKRLKSVVSFRTCPAPSQNDLKAISRIWILFETMEKVFISLKFYLNKKINKYLLWTDVNHVWLYLWLLRFLQPGGRFLSMNYMLFTGFSPRPSRSGGADYSSIDYSYQLAIFLYPQATCHFVICLLLWKLSNCMESRENSPWSLWQI